MNWNHFAKGLKGETRVECDIIPVDKEYGILIGTHTFAVAIAGLCYNVVPKAIEPLLNSSNMGKAKEIFTKQDKIERPFALINENISYMPGKSSDTFLMYRGIHEETRQSRTFFIKKKYYDLIPGEVISLCAPEGYGGILFSSTEAYGYILPFTPQQKDITRICEMADLLKKMH